MKTNTISDNAIVLSRVNYGETDRILNILCASHGKLSVIAKGVRKGKSKLAGGIELFAENELMLLKGNSDLYIVTSSRMKNYYGDIAKDLEASSYAYESLKMINRLIPEGAGAEYYSPLLNLLEALDKKEIPLQLIKTWFALKTLDNLGSMPNFKTDDKNKALSEGSGYEYDFDNHCFFINANGAFGSGHIKILRYLSRSSKPVNIQSMPEGLMKETEHLADLILKNRLE